MGLVAFLTAAAVLAPVGQAFRAVPAELEDIYRFDLAANFYADEGAFRADLDSLVTAIGELEGLKGRVTVSGDTLLLALSSHEQLYPRWHKLWVYANLRYAINTRDMRLMHEIQEASGDLSSRLQFINSEVEGLEDRTLQQLIDQEPSLRQLEFAIEDMRRYRPHRLSLEQEELLAKLDPLLLPWFEEMYQKIIDHTEFDSIQVDTGERLDARLDYGRLIRDTKRDVRKRAFLGHFGAYSQHRDLLSYVLLRELKTYNSLARLRDFPGRQEQRFFDLYLQPSQVWNVYSQIRARAGLAKRYERLRMARVANLTEVADAHAWDMSVVPEGFTRPRYDIVQATRLIRDALAALGGGVCKAAFLPSGSHTGTDRYCGRSSESPWSVFHRLLWPPPPVFVPEIRGLHRGPLDARARERSRRPPRAYV